MVDREEAIVLVKMMFAFWANGHGGDLASMETAKDMAISALRMAVVKNETTTQPAHIDREAWEPCGECVSCQNCQNNEDFDPYEGSYGECGNCCDFKNFKPRNFCYDCGRPLNPGAWAELEKRVRG